MKSVLLTLSLIFTAQMSLANDCSFNKKFWKKFNSGSVSSVTKYILRKSNLNTYDCRGKILLESIKANKQKLTSVLLSKNTNVNYEEATQNPLLIAIEKRNYYLIKKLLELGANPHQKVLVPGGKIKLIDLMVKEGQVAYANLLRDHGAQETLDCSLQNSMMPKCYHKRERAVLKIALVYYGDHMNMKDLKRIEPILKERFHIATKKNVEVEVISKEVITYKQRMPEGYEYNNIKDKKRLQRIWYYDNVGAGIMNEVYAEYKKVASEKVLEELDAIVAITGAQFDGLGFASGRVSVTEYPREIAWATEGGGRVELVSDYQIVDELIHELGHNMFLGHTSTQCQAPGMSLEQRNECCAQSPSKNDVLSYCRQRSAVDENFMHGFEECNVEMIEDLIVPAMLSGGKWQVSPRLSCE